MSHELIPFAEVRPLARDAAKSGLFRGINDEAKAVVKILAGRELGIGPVAALRGVNLVEGKIEFSAGLLAALVKRSGRYDYRVTEATDARCELAWTEQGKPVGTSSFTVEEAERAGLVKPRGAWTTYPGDMCFARALSRGVRRYAPDVTAGAAYVDGETLPDALAAPAPAYVDGETLPGALAAPAPAPEPEAIPVEAVRVVDAPVVPTQVVEPPPEPAKPEPNGRITRFMLRRLQVEAIQLERGNVDAVRRRWAAAGVPAEQVQGWGTARLSDETTPTQSQAEAFRLGLKEPAATPAVEVKP